MKKSTVSLLAVSAIVAVAGIVAVLLGYALPISDAAQGVFDYGSLLSACCASIVLALVYGFVRFDRAHALVLAVVTMHDLVVTYALTALISIVLPGLAAIPSVYALPYMLVLAVLFTFAQSLIVLRHARKIILSTSRREVPYDQAACTAAKESRCQRIELTVMALVLMLGIAGFGSLSATLPLVCPLAVAALVSFYTAGKLTLALWTDFCEKLNGLKARR